jgi:UDP-GlcNAc:undecaprenyl-phosphate GlcNAc-1-phosphate transferase
MTDARVLLETFLTAFFVTATLTPFCRWFAWRRRILDVPSTPVKTHRAPVPYLGGVAVYAGWAGALAVLRGFTNFPSGTLHALRATLIGGGFMMVVGLVDDLKPGGLDFKTKFFFQFMGALILMSFGIRVRFIQPDWLAMAVTVLWVVGVTNAFNIIDIMDGLASSQAVVAALGFLFISLPSEEWHVNFLAASSAGAVLAFLPYNLSSGMKIFLGDAGSLQVGFVMAALSLGAQYTTVSDVGVLAPLLILGLPLYDTFFVSALRIKQGKSPFLGSKDHLALKMKALGLSHRRVVLRLGLAAAALCAAAYWVTQLPFFTGLFLFMLAFFVGFWILLRLRHVEVP